MLSSLPPPPSYTSELTCSRERPRPPRETVMGSVAGGDAGVLGDVLLAARLPRLFHPSRSWVETTTWG